MPLSAELQVLLDDISSTNIKIGIRPEFVHVWDGKVEGAYECELIHADDLGTYQIIIYSINGASSKSNETPSSAK